MMHLVKLFSAAFELTTACPCRCKTCGSSAGAARPDELTTGEWLQLVSDLARLGCQRLCLLGGEPFLDAGWVKIASDATSRGMDVDLITCGVGVDDATIEAAGSSGLVSITVSVDGTRAVHDRLRRIEGGYAQALDTIRRLDESGMKVGVTTQVNRLTLPTLEALAPELQAAGAMGWQLQLTMPTGRARLSQDVVIDPGGMPQVHRTIRRLIARRGLRPHITDNIGYLTRDDPVLRTPQGRPDRCWLGCFAGLRAVGITSAGRVKGCLALPDELTEGQVREESLEEIWKDPERFAYNRAFDPAALSAECAACEYAKACRGGCTAVSMSTRGKPNQGSHCMRLQGVS